MPDLSVRCIGAKFEICRDYAKNKNPQHRNPKTWTSAFTHTPIEADWEQDELVLRCDTAQRGMLGSQEGSLWILLHPKVLLKQTAIQNGRRMLTPQGQFARVLISPPHCRRT